MNDKFNHNELIAYEGCELESFISRIEARNIMRKFNRLYEYNGKELRNKDLFLNKFKQLGLVKRDYYITNKTSEKELRNLEYKLYILKPIRGSWGRGIKLWMPDLDIPKNHIIEQRLKSINELAKYNTSTLNTIRIVTIRKDNNIIIFAALFRCGNGTKHIVDNAHLGGLFAEIDTNTGKVISNFVDVQGKEYVQHPNSKFTIKGIMIPHWLDIVDKSKFAALNTDNIVTGWDIAITDNEDIEFIEGNSRPDFDMILIPNKKGCKLKFINIMNNL